MYGNPPKKNERVQFITILVGVAYFSIFLGIAIHHPDYPHCVQSYPCYTTSVFGLIIVFVVVHGCLLVIS